MVKKSNKNIDQKKEFSAHQIYMKDMSISSPLMPRGFGMVWKPHINFDINVSYKEVKNSLYEVLLDYKLTVQLEEKDKKTDACQINIQQAGIFGLEDASEDEKIYFLLVKAPELLFPFIRENVSSSINRLGYPQVILPMINFEQNQ